MDREKAHAALDAFLSAQEKHIVALSAALDAKHEANYKASKLRDAESVLEDARVTMQSMLKGLSE